MEHFADKAKAIRDDSTVFSVMGHFDRPQIRTELLVALIVYFALMIAVNMVLIFGIRSQVRACFLPWLVAEIPLIAFLLCGPPIIYLRTGEFSSGTISELRTNMNGELLYLSIPVVLLSLLLGLVASSSWVVGFRLWRQMGRKVSADNLISIDDDAEHRNRTNATPDGN